VPIPAVLPIFIAPKGRFVGSIENHMSIGDQLEGKGFGLQLDSNE